MKNYKQFYENYAKNYPDDLVIRTSQLLIIKKLINYKNKVGLDVGSANGSFAMELAKDGAKKVYGIDIAKRFVENARKEARKLRIKNVEFKQADARKLPFEDEIFDFVICTEVLEHVPNFKKAIYEIKRVLRPNGDFVITVPNSLNPAEILHQLKHLIFYLLKGEPFTHINLFFLPTFKNHFSWAKETKTLSLHFILPFLPKKYINHALIEADIYLGKILKPFAFDIVFYGKKGK